jgi:hypothetical protein
MESPIGRLLGACWTGCMDRAKDVVALKRAGPAGKV